MVLLVLTERIRHAIYQAIQSPDFDDSAKQRLKNYLKSSACIPLDLVKEVSKFLVTRDGKLGKEIANKEYARMVGRVASSYDVETFKLLDTEEFQSIRGQLTAIINITFTVVAVFAAVYHVAQTITGDTGMRVLLAFTGSIIVGVAETFLYMRYLAGFDKNDPKKERKQRRRSSSPQKIVYYSTHQHPHFPKSRLTKTS
ncbi:6115_t:CDS:2 [Cetraspora pellucida]|uniref:6115_t:CDS:1 n=1 Tax=Cetraspora pellucida TaxID=1433469 RepID=A0ACA9JZD6_9GLOM|nr:6115_t:CDS:2 [Cetraspora pellucida]